MPYLDVPFQHGSTRILKLMRRPAATENTLEHISRWRSICPDITIRSTFIVGFPGETDEDFEHLLDFLGQARLDRVGCFQYSPVTGAAANNLPDHVPDKVKEERWHRFMQVQARISEDKLADKVGSTLQVLIDEADNNEYVGRSYADAPEIDGNVFVSSPQPLLPGDIVKVHIDSAAEYDLWGSVVNKQGP